MTQADPVREAAPRTVDGRRADSDRVIRKFALSAALQVVPPGALPEDIVKAARLFAAYVLNQEVSR